jgi:endonuclease/exonuclease/phosphatase (EEP) superfamily protein YafD
MKIISFIRKTHIKLKGIIRTAFGHILNNHDLSLFATIYGFLLLIFYVAPIGNLCCVAEVYAQERENISMGFSKIQIFKKIPEAEHIFSPPYEGITTAKPKRNSMFWALRCSWLGQKIGACNTVPAESAVLRSLGHAGAKSLNPNAIKVLIWNIYKGREAGWDVDMKHIGADVDLIMLQEFFLDGDSIQTFEWFKGIEWLFATSYLRGRDSIPTGVVTGANASSINTVPLRSPKREIFGPSGPRIIQTPKMALIKMYPLNGSSSQLAVVNVHGINYRETHAFELQMKQLERSFTSHRGPIIAAGDFNTWWHKRLIILQDIMRRNSLVHLELDNDKRTRVLDHVFARGLKIKEARLLNEYRSSDHKPIYVIFHVSMD